MATKTNLRKVFRYILIIELCFILFYLFIHFFGFAGENYKSETEHSLLTYKCSSNLIGLLQATAEIEMS